MDSRNGDELEALKRKIAGLPPIKETVLLPDSIITVKEFVKGALEIFEKK